MARRRDGRRPTVERVDTADRLRSASPCSASPDLKMPPVRRGRRAAETIHRLYVCTTCVRDLRLAPGEPSRGQRLADELQRRLDGGEAGGSVFGSRLHFLKVPCLNGCLRPCNVALRASGKYNLRLSRLEPEDAGATLDFTGAYLAHPTGDVPEAEWPAALRGKRTVRTPPPHLLLGSPPPGD